MALTAQDIRTICEQHLAKPAGGKGLVSLYDIIEKRITQQSGDEARWGVAEQRRVDALRTFLHWVDKAAARVERVSSAWRSRDAVDEAVDEDDDAHNYQGDEAGLVVQLRRTFYKFAMAYADSLVGNHAVTEPVTGGYDVLLGYVTSRGLR